MDELLGENNKRLKKQQEQPITVILGNPPYSAKQKNEDNNFKRTSYVKLDNSLKNLWVDTSTATNKNGLSDTYIKAMRWAADRISENGIIGFITNNSYIDGVSMDGMRKALLNEFSDIYVINLKGKIRGKTKKQIADFERIKTYLNDKYGYEAIKLTINESYLNMAEIIKENYYIIEKLQTAMKKVGIDGYASPIRGGTDGARLTFMGLPCPNIGTGGENYHGPFEFVSLTMMKQAVEIIKELVKE